jgi:phosphoribosylformimino-5-aminoimidazole carboxamide ribotide isomerase
MIVIPAIDLKGGRCVRLKQGRMEDSTVYGDDPAAMARHWASLGAQRIHVVDLDGAFSGRQENREAIRAIRAAVDVELELGGGIRDEATVDRVRADGIDYVILGTAALENHDFVQRAADKHPGKVYVGIDARKGLVAVRGWAEQTQVVAAELARQLAARGAAGFVYTDIDRDGMQTGVNAEATAAFAQEGGVQVIASGGVHTIDDIRRLVRLKDQGIFGVITGRAIYEGTLDLKEAIALAEGR